jgi:hypothetical protein
MLANRYVVITGYRPDLFEEGPFPTYRVRIAVVRRTPETPSEERFVRVTPDQFAEGVPIAVLGCGHELIVIRCLEHFRDSEFASL